MAASIHTHNFRQCSHASVGLAQAGPNKKKQDISPIPLNILVKDDNPLPTFN